MKKINETLDKYLTDATYKMVGGTRIQTLETFINKNKEGWDAIGYKSNDVSCCAVCKWFAKPRDGHGECFNQENAKKFLASANSGAKQAFVRDSAIPVEMLGLCPNFKKV